MLKKQTVYIETSVVSYLTAYPSRDIIVASHQQITWKWWNEQKQKFSIFISQFVFEEASEGNKLAAKRRLRSLKEIPLLEVTESSLELAREFVAKKAIPPKALVDALHIAVATVYEMDYLLTWNCKHIANAKIRRNLTEICIKNGYNLPTICTPEELMGENNER